MNKRAISDTAVCLLLICIFMPSIASGDTTPGSVILGVNNSVVALELWNFTAQKQASYEAGVWWSPTVVEDRVYALESERYNIPGEDDPFITIHTIDTLYALTSKGVELWNFTDTALGSPTIIGNTMIYIAARSEQYGALNKLYCLNASTGEEKWVYYSGEIQFYAVDPDGKVYLGAYPGSDYCVVALDSNTGVQLWKKNLGWNYHGGHESPSFGAGAVYIRKFLDAPHDINSSPPTAFCALNSSSGEQIWSFSPNEGIDESSQFADGIVYSHSYSAIYALNASSGKQMWDCHPDEGQMFGSPSGNLWSGLFYLVGYPSSKTTSLSLEDAKIYAFNASNGEKHWDFQLDGWHIIGIGYHPSRLDIIDGILYANVDGGLSHALDALSGQQLWAHSGRPYGVSNGTVYFVDTRYHGNQTVEALRAENGRSLGNCTLNLTYAESANGNLYFFGDRTLHAVSIETPQASLIENNSSIAFENTIEWRPLVIIVVVTVFLTAIIWSKRGDPKK